MIHSNIAGARIRKDGHGGFWVMHPCSDAILAATTTEAEAHTFLNSLAIDKNEQGPNMSHEDVGHFLAQAVLNIEAGFTHIEPGSRIHMALVQFCAYANSGSFGLILAGHGK